MTRLFKLSATKVEKHQQLRALDTHVEMGMAAAPGAAPLAALGREFFILRISLVAQVARVRVLLALERLP